MCSGMNKNDHEGETKNLISIIFLWKVYLKVQNTTSDPEKTLYSDAIKFSCPNILFFM